MKNYNLKSKILVFVLISHFSFLISTPVFAATPRFLLSWQAESYAPSWYQGKIFPTKGTPVEVRFELIDNGKIADLSRTKVRWYVNDELLKNEDSGLGIKSLRFNIPDYAGQETEVRIALPDYRGGQLDKIVKIPVKAPEVVIEANLPDRKVGIGENSFRAFPFFFNIRNLDNLLFEWLANNQAPEGFSENPAELNLKVDSQAPSGFGINLQTTVKNFLSELEFAVANLQLEVR